MEQANSTIRDLCRRYLSDTLDPVGLQQLLDYLRTHPDATIFLEEMDQAGARKDYPVVAEKGQGDLVLQRVLSIVRGQTDPRTVPDTAQIVPIGAQTVPIGGQTLPAIGEDTREQYATIPTRRMAPRWIRLAAAAIVLFLVTGIFLWRQHRSGSPIANNPGMSVPQDIRAPSGANAIITLANGEKIILDSVQNGTIATQGNIKLLKQADGGLAYEPAAKGVLSADAYNTINVPRGSKTVRLTLSDGTKVWLNAASSLRYPAAFQSQERRVEMTGEAYFEVAQNNKMPFIVRKTSDNTAVQVLGTHFNVNAYDDEENLKVTLLEGSVRLVKETASVKLTPGQQAQLNREGQIKLVRNADTAAAVAWKYEFFSFHGAGLQEVMRQLSRWYDIDVSFEGTAPALQFNGEIGRNLSLKDVLDGLAFTSIHYRLEGGRRLVVLP